MQISTKHMSLASPVFKTILSHGFAKGEALQNNGEAEIPLPNDDPTTFTVLLDVIHGRGRRVPRDLDLKTLALVQVAVDKYQLH
ncbi:hypothetical protein BKA65DRAFT_498940 [Rhexocercosporidium sp. MPI-PUGE-AT-0058]|nr:hypothetical protein BKA65DRAFT_498940 [Rhexocercosporidium sp. MPI-PUGE-AT-0058]